MREIGRELPPPRRRRRISAVGAIALTIAAVALIATLVVIRFENVSPRDDTSDRKATISYVVHDPILIDGNAGFTNETGVVWGSGTESDPYIIEGWDINASTANGIEIRNTDARFIVRTCQVYDGRSNYDGIHLYECANGTFDSNNCSNNWCGISLSSSTNNTLANNDCSNDYDGISLSSSNGNALSNNTCSSNLWNGVKFDTSCNGNVLHNNSCSNNGDGIYIYSSSSNILTNNDCSHDSAGISLVHSGENTLVDNDCGECSYYGIVLHSSSSNTLTNNNCSSGNIGIVVSFASNRNTVASNNCSSGNDRGIYVSDSSENIVTNNNCNSNKAEGISFYYSTNSTVSHNQCDLNLEGHGGILLNGSHDNVLVNNSCSGNTQYGMYLTVSNSNRIWNNTFIDNNGAGETYDPAHIQAYDDGTGNSWNSTNGIGNYWSDWTTPDVAPPDGIVDVPYDIAGRAGAKDYYPLTTTPSEPIPEFGMMPLVVTVFLASVFLMAGTRRRKAQ